MPDAHLPRVPAAGAPPDAAQGVVPDAADTIVLSEADLIAWHAGIYNSAKQKAPPELKARAGHLSALRAPGAAHLCAGHTA